MAILVIAINLLKQEELVGTVSLCSHSLSHKLRHGEERVQEKLLHLFRNLCADASTCILCDLFHYLFYEEGEGGKILAIATECKLLYSLIFIGNILRHFVEFEIVATISPIDHSPEHSANLTNFLHRLAPSDLMESFC